MIEQTLLLMAQAEAILVGKPPPAPTGLATAPSPFYCPKCQGTRIVQQEFKSNARGIANNERGPSTDRGRWKYAVYRCLDCNHKWSVIGV